ncbi:MBL fold metallo-hydrolase [Oscillospiraceae bacterium PP1C4]
MRKRKLPIKQWLLSAAALVMAFFTLVLLNEAMGGQLPLPGTHDIERHVDKLYTMAGISTQPTDIEGDVLVHYIDVGQGDCELIQTPEQSILIDAGDVGGGEAIADYLKAQGIKRLDIVIATHPHADHIGGMTDIIKKFEIGKVIFSEIPEQLIPTTKVYETLLDTISAKGLKLTKAKPDTQYDLGGGAVMTILAPLEQYKKDLNEYSVVCRVDFGETSFMFTGDASSNSENDMVETYGRKLAADVLKLGHHGSDTSSQEKWLSAVAPQAAIASLGYDNTYGHPHASVLRRLKDRGIALYRTDKHGTIVAATDGETLNFSTEK